MTVSGGRATAARRPLDGGFEEMCVRRLQIPSVGAGPAVLFERTLELELTRVQRVAVRESFYALVSVLVDDAEFEVA